MHVVVMGAGLMGLCTAYSLRQRGAEVTVVERARGPGLGTSYANGGLLHASLVQPWNAPGVLGQLLRSIGRQDVPMVLRLKALPSLAGWGLRFLAESREDRYRRNALTNLTLALHTRTLMAQWRSDLDLDYGAQTCGVAMIYRGAEALTCGEHEAALLAPHGVTSERLDRQQLLELEPALGPVSAKLVGAVYYPQDERGDAHRFCREMRRACEAQGVRFRFGQTLAALRFAPGADSTARSVRIGEEDIGCDAIVVAAGSDSRRMVAPLGLDLPIRPAKGYSVTVPRQASVLTPRVPIADADLHIAFVPIGNNSLRAVGTAEFAGDDLTLTPARVAYLEASARELFPQVMDATRPDPTSARPGPGPACGRCVPMACHYSVQRRCPTYFSAPATGTWGGPWQPAPGTSSPDQCWVPTKPCRQHPTQCRGSRASKRPSGRIWQRRVSDYLSIACRRDKLPSTGTLLCETAGPQSGARRCPRNSAHSRHVQDSQDFAARSAKGHPSQRNHPRARKARFEEGPGACTSGTRFWQRVDL